MSTPKPLKRRIGRQNRPTKSNAGQPPPPVDDKYWDQLDVPEAYKPKRQKQILPMYKQKNDSSTLSLLSYAPAVASLVKDPKRRQQIDTAIKIGTLAALTISPLVKWIQSKKRHNQAFSFILHDESKELGWLELILEDEDCSKICSPSITEFESSRKEYKLITTDGLKEMKRVTKYGVVEDPEEFFLRPKGGIDFIWKGFKYTVFREKEQDANYYVTRVIYCGESSKPLDRLYKEIIQRGVVAEQERAKAGIYTIDTYNDWSRVRDLDTRRIPVLPDGMFDALTSDISNWYKNESWYREVGIPYRRGIILHGVPGSGKTTAAMAIAAHFKKNIHIVPMENVSDAQLQKAFESVEDGDILLLEDIDISPVTKNREEQNVNVSDGFNLRTLLNLLDGALSSDNKIIIATTNHIEKIDKTILRPGRFDVMYEFTFATKSQIKGLAEKFKLSPEMVEKVSTEWSKEHICMAEVQNRLVTIYNQ